MLHWIMSGDLGYHSCTETLFNASKILMDNIEPVHPVLSF